MPDSTNIHISVLVEIDGRKIVDEIYDRSVFRNGMSDADWARFELLEVVHDIYDRGE